MKKSVLLLTVLVAQLSLSALDLKIDDVDYKDVKFKQSTNPTYIKLIHANGKKQIPIKKLPPLTFTTKKGEKYTNISLFNLTKNGFDFTLDGKIKYIKLKDLCKEDRALFPKAKKRKKKRRKKVKTAKVSEQPAAAKPKAAK